jgi:hypothetical protein
MASSMSTGSARGGAIAAATLGFGVLDEGIGIGGRRPREEGSRIAGRRRLENERVCAVSVCECYPVMFPGSFGEHACWAPKLRSPNADKLIGIFYFFNLFFFKI